MSNIIGNFHTEDGVNFIVYDDLSYRVSFWEDLKPNSKLKIHGENVHIQHYKGPWIYICPKVDNGRYKDFIENILMIHAEYNMLNSTET